MRFALRSGASRLAINGLAKFLAAIAIEVLKVTPLTRRSAGTPALW
jgi:hypothetical protein